MIQPGLTPSHWTMDVVPWEDTYLFQHEGKTRYVQRNAGLTLPMARATLGGVKQKKTRAKQPTAGTVAGAKYRVQCNQLPDSEREKLSEEFLKLYSAGSARESARRR